MKCEDFQRLLSDYVDNELDPEESELVKDHLSDCPTCQAVWREFNGTVQITRSLPELELPSDLLQRVKEGVSPVSKKTAFLRRAIRPLSFRVPAWSFAAVVLLLALYLVRTGPYPRDAVKVMTERIPPSSTETEEARITAGKEKALGEAPSLDVMPQEEGLPGKERQEPMRTKGELKERDRLTPTPLPEAPLRRANDRDGVLSFHSASRMQWTEVSIAGPAMARGILKMVQPEYPNWAKEQELKGAVEVMCLVLPSGEVTTKLIWLTSEWPELDQSVLQAMGEWGFEPIPGEEVEATIVRVAFDLSEE